MKSRVTVIISPCTKIIFLFTHEFFESVFNLLFSIIFFTDKEGKLIFSGLNNTLYEWGRLKTDSNSEATIYFSDGSRSLLQENSEFILVQADFQEDNNWITKIKLALTAWSIWTSATHLDEESEFGVERVW